MVEGPQDPGSARATVFLVDGSGLERGVVGEWIAKDHPGAHEVHRIPSTRAWDAGRLDPAPEARLARGDDPVLRPVEVAWLPRERGGQRRVRLFDLLTLGNPRAPGFIGQRWVLPRHPDRCRVVAGEPAAASALRERWLKGGGDKDPEPAALALFVLRQAALALERAERPLRGARYEVPRFVRQEILAHREFRAGLASLVATTGLSPERLRTRAGHYLKEIAARVCPYVVDLVHRAIRVVYQRQAKQPAFLTPAQRGRRRSPWAGGPARRRRGPTPRGAGGRQGRRVPWRVARDGGGRRGLPVTGPGAAGAEAARWPAAGGAAACRGGAAPSRRHWATSRRRGGVGGRRRDRPARRGRRCGAGGRPSPREGGRGAPVRATPARRPTSRRRRRVRRRADAARATAESLPRAGRGA